MNRIFPLLLVCAAMASCKKDDNRPAPQDPGYEARIRFVLEDNYTFSFTSSALQFSAMQDTMTQQGPYTMFAPTNAAWLHFNVQGVSSYMWQFFTQQRLRDIMQYHIVPGSVSLRALPLGTDTAMQTLNGGPLHLEKYLENGDTMITVNGEQVSIIDNYASNGNVNGIDGIMNPEQYNTVLDMMRNEPALTMFVAALQRAGLEQVLAGNTVYTVLAPVNDAFKNSSVPGMDLTSINGILQADPAALATLLKGHFLQGRYFQRDLYRAAAATGSIVMQNGKNVAVGGTATGYNSITFNGAGIFYDNVIYNPTQVNADMPAKNGVLFKIQSILQ
ncbi:hypothetical protein DCC81_08105 [Chitinophaga parva]|uniref:FAS1 domain-containing protein n=1 Tax=Chitinophaga parva TaxID=2169414 RepID=A0A2T7BP25_9BACT|nr:fasciclin domain-containing protein [Chitinophaga parva]PUZ29399.1 hypothetical protein DCC81_08105 [Chitinophaga parva]